MKITIAALLCCFTAVNSTLAQTNAVTNTLVATKAKPQPIEFITWTNKTGFVTKDAKVVRVDPDGIVWTPFEGIGGGKVKFTELPAALQKQFAYDPKLAEQFTTKANAKTVRDQQALAEGAQDQIEKRKVEMVRSRLLKTNPKRSLTVFQKIKNGILIRDGYGDFALVDDYPYASGLVDEDSFSSTIYPCGTFAYTTVGGSSKTVRRFTVDIERAIRFARDQGEY